ncbi:DUF3551 domain-containing protein [Bradyrhizobium sp. Leo121]|uniref:DUF3551 domain-containing protein n=1 Tax=Bradyrhizobium sp. Leo121 TaxID=1571195 RepID=UPI001028EC07|nr:hypothetical protein CWO90_01825 [Bradyrhizobium sp. Leo121]
MRYLMALLSAAGLIWIAEAGPATARDYPYCLQSRTTGIPGDCSFRTRAACMAAASGRGAICAVNPRVAFGRYHRRGRVNSSQ